MGEFKSILTTLLMTGIFLSCVYLLAKRGTQKMGLSLNVKIHDHERGFLYRDNNFFNILEPGRYWLLDFYNRPEIVRFDITKNEFEHPRLEFLIQQFPDLMQKYFTWVDLNEHQVGLVYLNNKLSSILPPGKLKVFWKGASDVRIETLNISERYEVEESLVEVLKDLPNASKYLIMEQLNEYEQGLLYINGHYVKTLSAGLYGFWSLHKSIQVRRLDLRLQNLEIAGQEILTKDKVTLRLNLSAHYLIQDTLKIINQITSYQDYLYKELQFAIREAVGTKTLDELLANKEVLNADILKFIQTKACQYGIQIEDVGIKDIILPGEMREIMNQVVLAEKVAQANLIKRREETAATRSLLNTAKLMEDNPTLLRLKELETLEKVTEKIDKISVFNGMDGLMKDLIKLK